MSQLTMSVDQTKTNSEGMQPSATSERPTFSRHPEHIRGGAGDRRKRSRPPAADASRPRNRGFSASAESAWRKRRAVALQTIELRTDGWTSSREELHRKHRLPD